MSGRHRRARSRLAAPTRLALTATAAMAAMQPLAAPPASAATTLPAPKPTRTLPTTLDVVPTYQEQRSCDPTAKPGVEAYTRMVLTTYRQGRSGGIVRGCGIGATSEHKEGRAWDWMVDSRVPAQKAAGDALTSWLTGEDARGVVGGNARRLGVMYVIWNRRMWSTYRIADGWRPYSGPLSHADHVHTSFTWDGAMLRTSWWDGSRTADDDRGPCRVYAGQPAPVYTGVRRTTACASALPAAPRSAYGIIWPGQVGSAVKVAQARLGVATDGVFDSGTRSKLLGWQRSTRVPVTGVLDKPTWARLAPAASTTPAPTAPRPPAPLISAPPVSATTTTLSAYKRTVLRQGSRGAAVSALQKAVGTTVDGIYGPQTAAVVRRVQVASRRPATGVVDAATWAAVERVAYPLLPFRATVLRQGSHGSAVIALQRALRVAADGAFGPKTAAALRAAQTKAKLPATGVTDVRTWIALEQAAYPLGRPVVPVPRGEAVPSPKRTAPSSPTPPPSAGSLAASTSVSAYKALVLRQGSRGTAVAALQRALGASVVDGSFGALTSATVKAFQRVRHLPATGVVDRRTWDAVELAAHPLLPYRRTVLRQGSRGSAVLALQRALHVGADGVFGPKTAAAVAAAQRKGAIASTGTVATLTWVTIEQQAYPLGRKRW